MTDRPLISVIIAVYNSEAYLPQCLDSVLAQTYDNLEIILVDDGSTDASGTLCDDYAKRDARVRVRHTANCGASAARNLALGEAGGELIGFVDSDDFIAADMYQHLFELLKDAKADVAQVALIEAVSPLLPAGRPEQVSVLEGDAILIHYLRNSNLSLQTRLHRRELFVDFQFDEGRINEDLVAGYLTLRRAERMVISDVPRYCYRVNRQGVTNAPLRQRDFDLFFACERLVALSADQPDPQIRRLALVRLRRAPFTLLIKMALYGASAEIDEQATQRRLRTELRRSYGFLMRSPMPANRKLLLTLVLISYPLTRWLARAASPSATIMPPKIPL
ncbi:MAG: glycosyltransferase [Coriobacteriales bacterium]|jgi:glycosyltransferase involved in cell wall biosynthesis|nr:glycosyltransferase [Coriobacteriales bacterium]